MLKYLRITGSYILLGLYKTWWAIRLQSLQAYYRFWHGLTVKNYPPEVMRRIYFPQPIDRVMDNGMKSASIIGELCRAHDVPFESTKIIEYWGALIHQRYEHEEAISLMLTLLDDTTEGLRRRLYRQMVEFQDISPRRLQFVDPDRAARVQVWLDATDWTVRIDDTPLPTSPHAGTL